MEQLINVPLRGSTRPDLVAFVIDNKDDIRKVVEASWANFDKAAQEKLIKSGRAACNYSANTRKADIWKQIEATFKRLFK